jgi:hypothetical protein
MAASIGLAALGARSRATRTTRERTAWLDSLVVGPAEACRPGPSGTSVHVEGLEHAHEEMWELRLVIGDVTQREVEVGVAGASGRQCGDTTRRRERRRSNNGQIARHATLRAQWVMRARRRYAHPARHRPVEATGRPAAVQLRPPTPADSKAETR